MVDIQRRPNETEQEYERRVRLAMEAEHIDDDEDDGFAAYAANIVTQLP